MGRHELRVDPATGIIETIFRGGIDAHALREAVRRRIALQAASGAESVLIDVREMTLQATHADIFDLPNRWFEAQHAPHRVRLAVVTTPETREDEVARFFATACCNRGWPARVFCNREAALKWLAEAR